MDNEYWKPVVGYEGLYEVSNLGTVKSLHKIINKGEFGMVEFPEKILKVVMRGPYRAVRIYKNKKGTRYSVHRLVAQAFIPNPKNKRQVNHIDGDKLNNNVNNLEWCTPYENTRHAIKNGLFSDAPIGEKNGQSKLTTENVLYIKNTRRIVSRRDLSLQFKISIKQVDRIRSGERWGHIR